MSWLFTCDRSKRQRLARTRPSNGGLHAIECTLRRTAFRSAGWGHTVRPTWQSGLDSLGIALDPQRNAVNAPLSSPDNGRVQGWVMRTNEALMIARSVMTVLKLGVP